jgi:CRP-like cAMP-binding protein
MIISTYDLLVGHPFLGDLPSDELTRLAMVGHRSVFHRGARIFEEGGRADRFWLIRDGSVQIDARLPDGRDAVVETLGPGTVLGWSWLFPPYRWHFGATAVEPTLTVVLDAAGVRELCADDPAIGYELSRRFMAVVIERLQATRRRLLDELAAPQ